MYPYNAQWLNTYGTARAMTTTAPTYTNETNQANSVPLGDKAFYGRSGVTLKTGFENALKPVAMPANPAAPDPKTTGQDTNTKAVKNPLVWVGLAAGLVTLFWLVRHA